MTIRGLKAWCSRTIDRSAATKPLSRVVLSVEVQGALDPQVLETWLFEDDGTGYESEDIAQELEDKALADASSAWDDRPRRYRAAAYYAGEEDAHSSEVFQVKARSKGGGFAIAQTPLPAFEGQGGAAPPQAAAQIPEAYAKMGLRVFSENQQIFGQMVQRTYGPLIQENERLHDRVHSLEDENLKLREQLLDFIDRRDERDAREREEQRATENRKEMLGVVKQAWAVLQAQQSGKLRQLPAPAAPAGAPEPLLLRIGRLLAALTEKELSALADCMDGERQREFLAIYMGLASRLKPYLEAEEKAQPEKETGT